MFEVSPRTIYRDIDTINMAGIPVRSTSGVGGGFEIMPEYKIDKKVFSTADLSAILMGLSSLSNLIRGEELVNALAKVRSFIPVGKTKDIELKINQIYIDFSQWVGNRNIQPFLEIIKEALQESRHWYLQGYCHIRNDFRLFKLSRISNLQIKEETFAPRDYQKPMTDFTETLEALQTKIKIRVHKSVLDRILDYCSYEDLISDGDAHYLVTFPFIENAYYYDILLSFGDKCECLEPSHIRAELKRRIHAIAALYE